MSRPLGQLFASSDILTGEEAAKLRNYISNVWMDPQKDLKDPYGVLLEDGNLSAFEEHFQGRVQHFEGKQYEAAQELFGLKWGPTRISVYGVLLALTVLKDEFRQRYIAIAKWLIDTAKVPVDGRDISGSTALMHSISTKPNFDPDFAQLMLSAGADINRRDRFGSAAGHDIVTVQLLYDHTAHEKAGRALQFFLEHGGDLDIKDGEDISARRIIVDLRNTDRTLMGVLDSFLERQSEASDLGSSATARPTARNSPCPCGSNRKFKKCCGRE